MSKPSEPKPPPFTSRLCMAAVMGALIALSMPTIARERAPLPGGPYLTLLAGYVSARGAEVELDDGYGAVVGAGYRMSFYAIEATAVFSSVSGSGENSTRMKGGGISGLVFPFQRLPGAYLSMGAGSLQMEKYPTLPNGSFSVTTLQGSLGHIWSFQRGRYVFGLRAEGGYRRGERETRINATRQDIDAPKRFSDALIHVGLHLPLSLTPPVVSEPATRPVRVVPPEMGDSPLDNSVGGFVQEEEASQNPSAPEPRDINGELDFLFQMDD